MPLALEDLSDEMKAPLGGIVVERKEGGRASFTISGMNLDDAAILLSTAIIALEESMDDDELEAWEAWNEGD